MNTPVQSRLTVPRPGFLARDLSFRLEQEKYQSTPQLKFDYIDDRSVNDEDQTADVALSSPRLMPTSQAWRLYFTQQVAFDWYLSTQMYILTLSTGMLDVTTYNAFGVFATKMTGNLLFLAVDAVDRGSVAQALEQNVATAICGFIAGAVAFGHVGRLIGRRRRLYLLMTNLLQTALILAATAIQYWGIEADVGHHAVIKMFLLAFSMAGQVSLAIGVGLPELNTTMITSSLIQLCYDPKIFHLDNKPRTRRIGFIFTMAVGHFAGAAAAKKGSPSLGILLTACIKGAVTLSFLFNPGMVMPATPDAETNSTKKRDGTVTPVSQILWGD